VCDQILAFEGSGRLHLCAGNYSYYQEKRAATAAAELALAQGFKAKGMGGKGKTEKPRKITQKELRELETIESEIVALEEAIAYSLFLTKKLKVTTVRLFNTVGPRQTGKYGMVIPRFIQSAIENNPINIFGDGSQTRVFCHVKDAVEALLLTRSDKLVGEVFNIGGKGEISILNLAKLVISRLNSKSKIIFTNYEDAYSTGFEEMMRRVPDIKKINIFTGWEPIIPIETIIDDVAHSLLKKI
jgi:nucleoside-diphosphate-sugar epimerase